MTVTAPLPPDVGSGRHRSLKIFVIGTGRSGTHWLGHILQAHPDIHVTIEQPPIFTWSTEMALDARTRPSLLPQLIAAYAAEHEAVAPRHYADKSHPNLWHAEELAAAFPEAVFLGIRRNPYATIASMLKHPWVLAWQDRWQEFPIPNRFLGITSENRAAYAALPQAARCALRWQAHMERLEQLHAPLGDRLLVVDYEDLVRNPELPIGRLNAFLRLPTPIPTPTVEAQSLDRWRDELPPAILRQIAAVTGIAIPPACPRVRLRGCHRPAVELGLTRRRPAKTFPAPHRRPGTPIMVGYPHAATRGDLPAPLLGAATADARLKNGWRLGATDPRLNSQVGRADGRSIVTDGRAGFLLFGPYATVPSGCWKASVAGSFIPGAGCVRIDVVSGTGRVVHAALELTAPAERADLEFQTDRTANDLEIRVWAHESATARIDTVALEGITDTGQSRLATDHDRRTFSITTGGRDDGIDESRVAQVRKAEAPTDSAAAEAATTANRDRDGDERAAGAAPRRPATVRDPARLREADGLDERVLDPAAGDGQASHRSGERTGGAGPHDARDGAAPGRHGPVPEGGLTSRTGPTFSIVIATDGRAGALAELLDTLPFLDGPPFEVCVVRGPTEDGISSLLDGWRGRIKTACNPVRNLSLSRNIGIAMAAGEIVAFLDDDAIPEADWLVHLAEAFADPAVACAGGVNRDKSGAGLQYGYATANRMGQARWDRTRPADELCAPGAPEYPYTQGTNTAIRRADLEALGGFDEEYEFYLDETDLCCRLVDAGRLVRQLPRAFVHHRSLPSAIRTAEGVTHSLFSVLKNKLYFSLVNNRGHHTVAEAVADYDAFVSIQERHLIRMAATSPDGPRWLERFAGDADQARTTGLARGRSGLRLLMSPGLIDEHRRPFLPLVRRPAADHVACPMYRQTVIATGTSIAANSPADHVRSQRAILHRTWADQLPRGTRIAIACDYAVHNDHWSVEDAAAWRGMRSLLPAVGVEIGYACDRWSYGPERLDRAAPRGPILVLGGEPDDDAHGLLDRIRADFPDRTIIQVPRHIGACDPDSRNAIAALLGTRCQTTLLLRDTQSLARARTQLLARSLLCPDATLALDLADVPRVGDVPVVALWRTDVATAPPLPPLPPGSIITDWLEPATATSPGSLRSRAMRAASGAIRPGNQVHAVVRRAAWRVLPLLWDCLAEERLLVNCRLLARGRVVVTNRLHGHLLCLLLGIPHVVCDTVAGEFITSSPTWPLHDPFTRVAATPAEAVAIAARLAGTAAPARSRAA